MAEKPVEVVSIGSDEAHDDEDQQLISDSTLVVKNNRKRGRKTIKAFDDSKHSPPPPFEILNGYFTIETRSDSSQKATCNVCQKQYSYHHSTSSLSYHLNHKHPFIDLSSPKAPPLPPFEVESKSILNFYRRKLSQQEEQSLTNALCVWTARNLRPLSIVEDDGLQEVIRIASGNSTYSLPSRQTLTRRLQELYTKKKEAMSGLLNQSCKHLALTADYWTSISHESYLGVNGFFIDENFEFINVTLGIYHNTERHTSANICDHIQSVMGDWTIDMNLLSAVVTDNARNMVNAVSELNKPHVPCMAHTIQLSINAGMKAADIEETLKKARKYVGHYKHSPIQSGLLKQQTKLTLIQDVPTRWGSTLQMIERLMECKNVVIDLLSKHKHSLDPITDAEWRKLNNLKDVLQPCEKASTMLGGDKYVTCSVVLPVFNYLKKEYKITDDDSGFIIRFKEAFLSDLQTRLDKMDELKTLQMACAFDPQFKSLKCLPRSSRENVWTEIENLMSNMDDILPPQRKQRFDFCTDYYDTSDNEAEPNDTNELNNTRTVNTELHLYRNMVIPDQTDPLKFWLCNKKAFPKLTQLARKFLGIPATSVTTERLFSCAGEIISKKRSNLTPENSNMLLSLAS